MKKTERNLLIVVSLVLILLFVLSSTDLVLGEKKNEVYVISVLIDDNSGKGWENFRMGMDSAAEKWNADVSFVTLYDKGDTQQQKQLLLREIENGADAIILSPTNCDDLIAAVDDVPVNIPIISLGARVDSPRVRSLITSDANTMGAQLGAKIAADHQLQNFSQVIEVTYRRNRTDTEQLSDSLCSSLPDGLPVQKVVAGSPEELEKFMMELRSLGSPTAVVATDSGTLLAVAEGLESSGMHNLSLYGVGWNSSLLRYIESGLISDIGVYNDYDIGFLSVEAAVNSLMKEPIYHEYKVSQALITAADIHSKNYAMMLFPIV